MSLHYIIHKQNVTKYRFYTKKSHSSLHYIHDMENDFYFAVYATFSKNPSSFGLRTSEFASNRQAMAGIEGYCSEEKSSATLSVVNDIFGRDVVFLAHSRNMYSWAYTCYSSNIKLTLGVMHKAV